jgi:hypothetical protein
MKGQKGGHHGVEEFGPLEIVLEPIENTFATRQLVSGAFA